jgi:hypothetical protein
MTDDIFTDRFHWCALAAGFLAAAESHLHDSEFVRRVAYRWYEEGAFKREAAERAAVVANLPELQEERPEYQASSPRCA